MKISRDSLSSAERLLRKRFPPAAAAFVCLCLLALAPAPRCGAAPGDEHWDPQFGWPGVSNTVYAVSLHEHKLYAAGNYQGLTNNQVDVWNGTNWSAIPGLGGSSVSVFCLGWEGNVLYAGGSFTRAGNAAVGGLARWDGTNWSDVGGFSGVARSLAFSGGKLYVGGNFTNIGGVFATNVACWNGTSWSALGPGLGTEQFAQYVQSLCLYNGELYAGGYFTNSGSVPIKGIARWDGTNWQPVGGGLTGSYGYPGTGMALAADASGLYVAGAFNTAGPVLATNIARWDGANWFPLGNGLGTYTFSLQAEAGYLYAGGNFTSAGGLSVLGFARWNGSAWESLGGANREIYSVAVDGTNIYVGGGFTSVSGFVSANHVARYDGSHWSGLGQGLGLAWYGREVAASTNGIYVGGYFSAAGQTPANQIARWDGSSWSAVGSGITGSSTPVVYAIKPRKSELYVGGVFTNCGGVTANNIAKYDGRFGTWTGMGSGANDTVMDIDSYGSTIYAGGLFTTMNGVPANRIAYWDGLNWYQLAGGVNSNVNTVVVNGTDIYLGGRFTMAAGIFPANRVVRWTGSTWQPLGSGADNGVNSTVNAIAVNGTDVYVGGSFTQAGSLPANRVAKWDGASWWALGSGFTGTSSSAAVQQLLFAGGYLYAAGNFTNSGGVRVAGLARWDGTNWLALGSGLGYTTPLPATGFAMAALGDDLYVAGTFYYAGTKDSYYFARWNDTIDFASPAGLILSAPAWSAGQFHFRITANPGSTYVIEASTNSSNWQPWFTNATTPLEVTDSNALAYPQRFYRARGGP